MLYFFIALFFLNLIIFLNFEQFKNKLIQDLPDLSRKKHTTNTPLFGGILLVGNFLVYTIIFYYFFFNSLQEDLSLHSLRENFIFNIYILLIFLIGLYDDKYNLSASIKTILLLGIILFAVSYNPNFQIQNIRLEFVDVYFWLGDFSIIFTVILIFFYINALNLYDGIDMQIGGYLMVIFIFFIVKGILLSLSICLVFALIFFLILNSKSKAFMGDSGVYFSSALISYVVIINYNKAIINSEEIILLTLIPVVDSIRLFFTRIISNKNPFNADNNHLHHRLNSAFGKTKAAIITFIMMIVPLIMYYIKQIDFEILILLLIFFYIWLIARYKKTT
tara:strand:+ start:102 stop:1103 length:1002 start_codon:yes stop_codon:yes gene_type:complete